MKIEVRYFTKSGNTEKLATAVASAAGVGALPVSEGLTGHADILFLGSSVYAGKPAAEISEFIRKNASNIGRLVVFGSSASGKSSFGKIKELAGSVGIEVEPEYFHCPGHFLWMHRNRPDAGDLNEITGFAKKMIAAD